MHKVVLLTDRPEECETLIPCLKTLFPECDIQVQSKVGSGSTFSVKLPLLQGSCNSYGSPTDSPRSEEEQLG